MGDISFRFVTSPSLSSSFPSSDALSGDAEGSGDDKAEAKKSTADSVMTDEEGLISSANSVTTPVLFSSANTPLAVEQYDVSSGEVISSFISSTQAALELSSVKGLTRLMVSLCCIGE